MLRWSFLYIKSHIIFGILDILIGFTARGVQALISHKAPIVWVSRWSLSNARPILLQLYEVLMCSYLLFEEVLSKTVSLHASRCLSPCLPSRGPFTSHTVILVNFVLHIWRLPQGKFFIACSLFMLCEVAPQRCFSLIGLVADPYATSVALLYLLTLEILFPEVRFPSL